MTEKRNLVNAEYSRPIKATLHVHLATGESWEATPEDLAKFGLDKVHDAYFRFDQALGKLLGDAGLIERRDVTRARLNIVRYLAETAIVMPDLLDHPDHVEDWARIVEIERILQQHLPEDD